MGLIFYTMLISFIVASICGGLLIPVLRRLKFGQEIREEGPKWHKTKSGTPTMGGLIFIIAIIFTVILTYILMLKKSLPINNPKIFALIMVSVLFGVIGFIDDYIKVILKRNLGLTALQKFGLQLLVSLGFAVWVAQSQSIGTDIIVPFMNGTYNLKVLFIPFAVLVMLATVNSVNLTDGLDGLAASVTIMVSIFFCIMANITDNMEVAIYSSVVIGGLLGFLIYNKYPAKVFMGDTGSLFLGGAVSAIAILMKMPVILLIVGFVYAMESLSVILQVASFKLTKKRIFRMSPIHHHFEMCGWGEKKIVIIFTLVTVLLCVLGYFLV